MNLSKTIQHKKLSVTILGVGAIGTALSYFLLQNELLQLHFYNRSSKPAIKIKHAAIKYTKAIDCKTNLDQQQHSDWLLICLKEHQFTAAEPFLKNLISPQTKVAVIRNGLRLKESVLQFTAAENILTCIIDCPCQPTADGFYQLFAKPNISIPKGALAEDFIKLFPKHSIDLQQIDDFKSVAWKKVCESSALGALLAAHEDTCRIFKNPKMVERYKRLLSEGIAVARADGAHIEDDFVKLMLEKLFSYPENKGSSMLTDRLAGKTIELGAKNGVITALGKVYGIATPEHEAMCKTLFNAN